MKQQNIFLTIITKCHKIIFFLDIMYYFLSLFGQKCHIVTFDATENPLRHYL